MSPIIETGISYEEAVEASAFELLPDGLYETTILSMESKTSKKGRPMLKVEFSVVNNDEAGANGAKLFSHFVLPHEGNSKGIFNFVAFNDALGVKWDGQQINTDDYTGQTIVVDVVTGKPLDNNQVYNEIKSFVSKKTT